LIRFLIDGGSNPNVHRQVDNKEGIVVEQAGTVLDIFASKLLRIDRNTIRTWPIDNLVYTSLVEAGAAFSRPLATPITKHPSFYFVHFEQEMEELLTFEEQVDGIFASHCIVQPY
jgi:hypothetical protein